MSLLVAEDFVDLFRTFKHTAFRLESPELREEASGASSWQVRDYVIGETLVSCT